MASDVDYMHENISQRLVSGDIPDWGDKNKKRKIKTQTYHHYDYDYRSGIFRFKDFKKAILWAKETGNGVIVRSENGLEFMSKPYWKEGKPTDEEMLKFMEKNAERLWYKDNPLKAPGSYQRID